MIPLRKVKEIPATLSPKAIERAVTSFIDQSHAENVDRDGYFNQIIENIAAVVVFQTPGRYFWIAEADGEVIAWALTHISKDVDNKLCYWQTDAWVDPKWRRKPEVKQWNKFLEEDAKANFCKHILIPSSRGEKAYCRFLGEGWHPYVVLLKKDL
jgi:hypothetical protein